MALCPPARATDRKMSKTPNLIWAQRAEKVFVTFEMINTKDVTVTLSEGLLSLVANADGKKYALENMPLWAEIDTEDSKWFRNDRCAPLRGFATK